MRVERLEKVTQKDARELKAVYKALEPDKRPPTFDRVLPLYHRNLEVALFVARNEEGVIRGFANASIEKSTGYGCSHWTCVHPRNRDAVAGRQLMKAKLNWLVNEAKASRVSADGFTPVGRALLKYFGFEPIKNWEFAALNFAKFRKRLGVK